MGLATNYLICYDITEDDTRFAVADLCKDAGLIRIQYSVFFGTLEKSQLLALKIRLKEQISDSNADIHIIKVCQSCERDHQVLSSYCIDDTQEQHEDSYEDVSEELDQYGGVLVL